MTAQPISTRTQRFLSINESDLDPAEVVLSAADATENRGRLPLWSELSSKNASRVVWFRHVDRESVNVTRAGSLPQIVNLKDKPTLASVIGDRKVLLDISGFQHHAWAPIVRSLFSRRVPTRILYAEPEAYKQHPTPASASLFDLSTSFDGLAPLPGFVQLSNPPDLSRCLFIALLGFEGNRPISLVSQLDPLPKVIPVVGVPGFQIEFPAYTVTCNRTFLDEYRAHSDIRLARASCPFEAFETIADIRRDYANHYLYLAPIGTKPHALGSILYALANPAHVEVMFDHPVRKAGRTDGVGVIHIYDLHDWYGIRH